MNKLNQNEMIMYASKWNKLMAILFAVLIIEVCLIIYLFVSKRIAWPNNVEICGFEGTFLSICTTFIVGFQIWNYISASDKLKELEEKKNILTQEIQELKEAKLECRYYNAYTIGCIRYQMAKNFHEEKDKRNYWNALRAFTKALLYAKDGGHDFESSYDAISKKVSDAINSIFLYDQYMIRLFDFDKESKCLIMMETINANMQEIQMYIKEKYTHIHKYADFSNHMETWTSIYTSILQNEDRKKKRELTHFISR